MRESESTAAGAVIAPAPALEAERAIGIVEKVQEYAIQEIAALDDQDLIEYVSDLLLPSLHDLLHGLRSK